MQLFKIHSTRKYSELNPLVVMHRVLDDKLPWWYCALQDVDDLPVKSPHQVRQLLRAGVTRQQPEVYHRMIKVVLCSDVGLASRLLRDWTINGHEQEYFAQACSQPSTKPLKLLTQHVGAHRCPDETLDLLIEKEDWHKVRLLAATDSMRRAVARSRKVIMSADATTLKVLLQSGVKLHHLVGQSGELDSGERDVFDVDLKLVPWSRFDEPEVATVLLDLDAVRSPRFFVAWLCQAKTKKRLLREIKKRVNEVPELLMELWSGTNMEWLVAALAESTPNTIVESGLIGEAVQFDCLFEQVCGLVESSEFIKEDLSEAVRTWPEKALQRLLLEVYKLPVEAALHDADRLSLLKKLGAKLPSDQKFADAVANCNMTFAVANRLLEWGMDPQVFRGNDDRLLKRAISSSDVALTQLFCGLFKNDASYEEFYNEIFGKE